MIVGDRGFEPLWSLIPLNNYYLVADPNTNKESYRIKRVILFI